MVELRADSALVQVDINEKPFKIDIVKPYKGQTELIETIRRMQNLDYLKTHYKKLYNIDQDEVISNNT